MDKRPNSDFRWSENFVVNDEVFAAFEDNGYIMLRGLLDHEEVTKLGTALESDEGVLTKSYQRDDSMGKKTKTVLWNHPGNDITGILARSEKMAGTFEKLLGGEVYHYHTKVVLKEPKVGGTFLWHQDYGYWYNNGNIFPNMGTVWVAVDKSDKENGCVQLLTGSHKVGRVEHTKIADQMGADLERVEHVKKVCPLIYAECEPGDAFFFHCNVLHTSAQNHSDRRRWGFLVSYNRADNNPVYDHHHPKYTPLEKVPNSSIKECSTSTTLEGKDFYGGSKTDYALKKHAENNCI